MNSLLVEGVAKWDGVEGKWSSLGTGVSSGGVNAIAIWEGTVYVGGYFTKAGDIWCSRLARFNGTDWSSMGDVNGDVRSLIVSDGKLYMGGDFTMIDRHPISHIAVYRGQFTLSWLFKTSLW